MGVCDTQFDPSLGTQKKYDPCIFGEAIGSPGDYYCIEPIAGPCWVTDLSGATGMLAISLATSDCSAPPNMAFGESDGLLATAHTRIHYLTEQKHWNSILLSGYGQLAIQVKSGPMISIGLLTSDIPLAETPAFVPELPQYWHPGWSERAYTTVAEGTNLLNVTFPAVSDLFIPTAVAIHYEYLYPPC